MQDIARPYLDVRPIALTIRATQPTVVTSAQSAMTFSATLKPGT